MCSRVDGGPDLLREDLDRREDCYARRRDSLGVDQVDRVLDAVALVRQCWIGVDRGASDEELSREVGRVDRKDMTGAPIGTQAEICVYHCMHGLIQMECAFHQRFDFAGAGNGDCWCRRSVAQRCSGFAQRVVHGTGRIEIVRSEPARSIPRKSITAEPVQAA
jgi:hypothetical protein